MISTQEFIIPKDIVIAIPAYRAEKELSQFLPHLLNYIPASQVVVLIDGDYDSSKIVCKSCGIQTIIHPENRGKGAALTTLFHSLANKFSWIITMDADGQHIPEDIPQFIDKIKQEDQNCAIVVGSRNRSGTSMPFARKCSNGLTSWFLSLVTGQVIADSQCGYRAYRSSVVQSFSCRYTRFEMESEILILTSSLGHRITNVPVSTIYNGGPSHISHLKDTLRWIRAVFLTTMYVRNSKGNK